MKKFFCFIAVAAVMTVAMTLSSCSHDDYYYSPEKVEKAVNDNYAASFEKAFGKVGPNVDWGFSSKGASARAFTRAKGDYDGYGGSMEATLDPGFPEDCAASKFITVDEIPTTAQAMPDEQGGVGPYYIDANTTQVDSWSSQCVIYVKGNVDMSNKKFELQPGATIYLPEGTSLKLGIEAAKKYHFATYIANKAQLLTEGQLYADNKSQLYNHGVISAASLTVNSDALLYNVGELTTGEMTVESNTSRIVNDGAIYSGSITVKAGAVQNNAEWTVTGTTSITTENSGWVNNGHWTTDNYSYIGGSENIINNCYLQVTNDFEMNIDSGEGAFKISNDGGVLTQNFYGGRKTSANPEESAVSGPFKIVMGNRAVFKVKETAQFESGRGDDDGFGIFGLEEGDYAVFQAKNIVRDATLQSNKNHGAVGYGGHLYISAETHFAQGYDSEGDGGVAPKPFIYAPEGFLENNIYAGGFKSGKPDIDIDESPCSPGFKGEKAALYRVIAEDLSASESSDFDFNDVVFDVVKAEGGKTTLKLICAGGVLPLRVQGREVHGLFEETTLNANGEYPMINTGAGPEKDPVTFEIDGKYTTPEEIKNITIDVFKNGTWMELHATRGEAACKILVDDTFIPVRERRNIADENNKFTDYVQGEFVDEFWWK